MDYFFKVTVATLYNIENERCGVLMRFKEERGAVCVTVCSPWLVNLPCGEVVLLREMFVTHVPGLVGPLEGPCVGDRGVLGHDVCVGLSGLVAGPGFHHGGALPVHILTTTTTTSSYSAEQHVFCIQYISFFLYTLHI